MPRKKLIRSTQFPYHITARANNKEAFPIAMQFVWRIMVEELYLMQSVYGLEVHAFVLMPNHFHLLATATHADLGQIMCMFMARVSKNINGYSGRTGHVFGGPYFWSMITSTRYFGHVLKYVYRNPVRANLSHRIEEYEFSTASGIFGITSSALPIHFTRIGLETNLPDIENSQAWLSWLNMPFSSEFEKMIQKSLRKKIISEIINRSNRRPITNFNAPATPKGTEHLLDSEAPERV